MATLRGAWRYRVSAGTGRPGVSILWLGEAESLICNFYLSVAARKIVWADPSLRYSHVAGTLSNQQTNKQTSQQLLWLLLFGLQGNVGFIGKQLWFSGRQQNNFALWVVLHIRSVNCYTPLYDRLVGLVVKASASRAGGPGLESR